MIIFHIRLKKVPQRSNDKRLVGCDLDVMHHMLPQWTRTLVTHSLRIVSFQLNTKLVTE